MKRTSPPALTPEAREKQLVNLAVNEAEKRILNGTASSQLLTHFLKLGSTIAELEKAKLENENLLLQAKTAAISEEADSGKLYLEAIDAIRGYRGEVFDDGSEDI